MNKKIKAISLFSGAGGMDIGFQKAGVDIIWANELDKDACETYKINHPQIPIMQTDINTIIRQNLTLPHADLIFGGPPCQGFSVAGKMNPNDERSQLIWSYLSIVEKVSPKAFVMENVKSLATLNKWNPIKVAFLNKAQKLGYTCFPVILNAADYNVPQKRERVFFIGLKDNSFNEKDLVSRFSDKQKKSKAIRDELIKLGKAGTPQNPITCTAKITLAKNPVLRKSPYAGMLFNGAGRPINLNDISNTLPASMGGNKTPIIDEELLYNSNANDWIEEYHNKLIHHIIEPQTQEVPKRLRRLTINEAAIIQTFPTDYIFAGAKTAVYRQIGNAVPCNLAYSVAQVVLEYLAN